MDERTMYQEHILDLYKHPENFGKLKNATNSHRGNNPLCGDDITMQVVLEKDKVKEIKFEGSACALGTASASLLTEKVKGMDKNAILRLGRDDVLSLLNIPVGPVRLKCVLLPLEALQQALGHGHEQ